MGGGVVADQTARWRSAAVTPVVDFTKYSWLTDVPELAAYLQKHHPYVEHFDLMRIEYYLSAWRRTADFDALEKMIAGIKGIMGEIAARREIVDEYRNIESTESVLVVAPQIFSGGDVLERSDAMIVGIDGDAAVIEKIWEVITAEDAQVMAHAREQHDASVRAYQKGGVIFRNADGRVFTCASAFLCHSRESGNPESVNVSRQPDTSVIRGDDKDMDTVLDALRNHLVAMMEMDLVNSRVKNNFVPTIKELQEILRDPKGVERLIGILGAHAVADDRIYLVGRVERDGRVTGLQVVIGEELGKINRSCFLIGFDPIDRGYVIREARGSQVLDFAIPFVEAYLDRELEMPEKSFFATILGTRRRSRSEDERLMVEDLAGYIRENGINRLLDLMSLIGVNIPDGRIFLSGRLQRGGQVLGLRIISAEEANSVGAEYFLLGFDVQDENHVLREVRSRGALDIALSIVESHFGRQLDLTEKSFFARILGTYWRANDSNERLMLKDLAEHLRKYGIERLLELATFVSAVIPEGRIYFTGRSQHDDRVTGFRMVDGNELGSIGNSVFLLGFDPLGEDYAFREAKGAHALDFALPIVESCLGRVLDRLEYTFLAGVLGTKPRSQDVSERLSFDDLIGHLRNYGIERLLEIARFLSAPVSEGRIRLTGFVMSDGRVTGIRIVGAEEAENLNRKSFLITFDPKDGAYHLDRENIRAPLALKKALLS